MDLSRRSAMLLGTAAAVVAALPVSAAVGAPAPKFLSWVAGTPGEFDWLHCGGMTVHEARLDWLCANIGETTCEKGGDRPREDCDCEFCCQYNSIDVERVEAWDGKERPSPGDWIRAGLGARCSRCDYETYKDEGGHGVGDEAVCSECMTIEDWDKVDPIRAAELRADLDE